MRRVLLLIPLVLSGCRFQPAGLPPTESPPDAARPAETSAADLRPEDGPATDRLPPHDLPTVDGLPSRDLPPVDLSPTDAFPGRWYQADEALCPEFCQDLGLENVAGPEGASCMSGEVRPQSGLDLGILLIYGCPGACKGQPGPFDTFTIEHDGDGYCYKMEQKQDWDTTDKTVGCYCR